MQGYLYILKKRVDSGKISGKINLDRFVGMSHVMQFLAQPLPPKDIEANSQ